jgi:hypothetical protein
VLIFFFFPAWNWIYALTVHFWAPGSARSCLLCICGTYQVPKSRNSGQRHRGWYKPSAQTYSLPPDDTGPKERRQEVVSSARVVKGKTQFCPTRQPQNRGCKCMRISWLRGRNAHIRTLNSSYPDQPSLVCCDGLRASTVLLNFCTLSWRVRG